MLQKKLLTLSILLGTASNMVYAASFNTDFATRVNGTCKMISTKFPAFKPYADYFSGFSDLILGRPAAPGGGPTLIEINEKLDNISGQLTKVSDQIQDFRDHYTDNIYKERMKSLYSHFEVKYNNASNTISNARLHLDNTLSQKSIDEYLQNKGCTSETTITLSANCDSGIGALMNDFMPIVATTMKDNIDKISDKNDLSLFMKDLNDTQTDSSTPTRKVNYIALREYYSSVMSKQYIQIMSSLYKSYQANSLAIYLMSKSGGSNYHQSYINYFNKHPYDQRLNSFVPGVNENRSYADNMKLLDDYYNDKIKVVNDVFMFDNMQSVYRDLPFPRKQIDKLSPAMNLSNITYYDGERIKGKNGSIDFDIPQKVTKAYLSDTNWNDDCRWKGHNCPKPFTNDSSYDNILDSYPLQTIFGDVAPEFNASKPSGHPQVLWQPNFVTLEQLYYNFTTTPSNGGYVNSLIKHDLHLKEVGRVGIQNMGDSPMQAGAFIGSIHFSSATGGMYNVARIVKYDPNKIYPERHLIPNRQTGEIELYNPSKCNREYCGELINSPNSNNGGINGHGNPVFQTYVIYRDGYAQAIKSGKFYQFGINTGIYKEFVNPNSRHAQLWGALHPVADLMCISTNCRRDGGRLRFSDGTSIYLHQRNQDHNTATGGDLRVEFK